VPLGFDRLVDPAPLSPDECRDLLRAGGIGRVAVSISALPAIFPVHYRLVGDDIVFHAPSPQTAAPGALAGTVIAFEADGFDSPDDAGWSVLVVGRVEADRSSGSTRVPSARISGLRFDGLGSVQA
jgi:nitroimidazol reductase NimA-like FMN-containing flavoprotein (pyridoxamine 5'-phosphate oxidase superfamily)